MASPAGSAPQVRSVVGKICPQDVGIDTTGEDFDFVVFADPQGGDPTDKTNDSPQRTAIHNPFIQRNVEAVNRLRAQPAFVVVAGDIVDSKGQKSNYDAMLGFLKPLRMPVLFELGNHETRYSAKVTPDDMSELENYFAAQKQINGLDKLLYSFDLGRWHFVIWPDPLRTGFWDAHPHFFDWLGEDLRRHRDRPTIVIHHVSLLPLGIDPMIAYAESIPVKRRVLDILTRYGTVKYVLSGHTHVPLKASVKTARTYQGTAFINLPPAGYRARGFGEPDFENAPPQGFALIAIRGEQATVHFERPGIGRFTYPSQFPEFRPADWPLWLTERWELPAQPRIVNGAFADGLTGWARRFVYEEDKHPSAICRAAEAPDRRGSKALYLFCRERGYHIRGQDRMPQTINRICQAVTLPKDSAPLLRFAYRIDGRHFDPDRNAGACVWLEGYSGSDARLHMAYWVGQGIANPAGLYGRRPPYLHWDITATPDTWHEAVLSIAHDWQRGGKEPHYGKLDLDRLLVTLGVWTENIETGQNIGVYFTDMRMDFASDETSESRVDERMIEVKSPHEIWSKRIVHIDGEHVFADS